MKHGADINAKGPAGESVFQEVMEGRAILCTAQAAILLADYHPDLTCQNSSGDGVVTMALQRGPVLVHTTDSSGKNIEVEDAYACPRKFINAGAAIDNANHDGITPLMYLVQGAPTDASSPMDIIKLLLAKGADPERQDKHGKSAIDRAIAAGDYDLLLVLDTKKAHRDAYAAAKQRVMERQLSTAVQNARFNEAKRTEAIATMESLLKEGVDPNAPSFSNTQTIFGQTLVESTASTKARQLEMVTYLLDHGADPNKPLPNGTIPLEVAVHEPEIYALLLARGAKLNRNLELAQAASQAEIEDIRETIFRHQFGRNASGQQSATGVYFLSILDEKSGKEMDPSADFLKRFSGNQPRVAAVSECKASAEKGVRDIKTGEQGLIFSVGTIRWLSETNVEVGGGYYEAGLSASGNTYTLEKKDGKWNVTSDVMNWIS